MVDVAEDYREYCEKFNAVWQYLSRYSKGFDSIVDDICEYRLYFDSKDRWSKVLKEMGVLFIEEGACDYTKLNTSKFDDMALFSKEGRFLLDGRYIVPVRDMLGNIIALIGWYPDTKKYVTTPSKYFVRDCLFFGMEQIGKSGIGKPYFVVEGIFDSLCLRSLGFNAVAQMGIKDSRVKSLLYGLFGRVVAIPDNDGVGRKVILDDKWDLPRNASYFRWKGNLKYGDEEIYIKDIDKLCSMFDDEDLINLLNGCLSAKGRVISIEL